MVNDAEGSTLGPRGWNLVGVPIHPRVVAYTSSTKSVASSASAPPTATITIIRADGF